MNSPRHIPYSEIADRLIVGAWGYPEEAGFCDASEAIKGEGYSRLTLALMIDIATSLRVLRCQNFQNIPFKLDAIKRSVARIPKRKVKK